MAVAVDAVAADALQYATSSISITTFTVGTGSNRALIAALTIDPTITGITVHWDTAGTNQAMTLIGSQEDTTETHATVYLYGLVAPTSGNKTLTASWTGTDTSATLAPISFTGVNQTGGTTSFAHVSKSVGTGNPSATVTSATGDFVVGAWILNNTPTSTSATQWYLDTAPSNWSTAASYSAGSSTVTFTSAPTTGTDGWAFCGVDIVAAAVPVTITETASASDSVTATRITGAAITETGSASDTVNEINSSYVGAITESGSASDSVTATLITGAAITETGSASDSVTATLITGAAITETGSASDTVNEIDSSYVGAITETGSASDSVNEIDSSYVGAITESGSASDTVTGTSGIGVAITESGSASDSVNEIDSSYVGAIAETGSASDTVNEIDSSYVGAITETGSASDTVTGTSGIGAAITETGSASDSVNEIDSSYVGAITETGSASDSTDATNGASMVALMSVTAIASVSTIFPTSAGNASVASLGGVRATAKAGSLARATDLPLTGVTATGIVHAPLILVHQEGFALGDLSVQALDSPANDTMLTLTWSDTGGYSWSNPVRLSLGTTGQYLKNLSFRRLGYGRNRVFRLSWSANRPAALTGAFIQTSESQT